MINKVYYILKKFPYNVELYTVKLKMYPRV